MDEQGLFSLVIKPGEQPGVYALTIDNPTNTDDPPDAGRDANGALSSMLVLDGQTYMLRTTVVG